MSRDARRRRVYRSRGTRRRHSLLVLCILLAVAGIVLVAGQAGRRGRERVTYDRHAAAAYADAWALRVNPQHWSSPDSDCANFVSQCLAAGGLRPLREPGLQWHANGTEFPTVAWVNCGAQKRTLSARSGDHSACITGSTRARPARWGAGDVVYLGNRVDDRLEWQHVIICVGRKHGQWLYDSHTTPYRRKPLAVWYPGCFSEIRYCRIADVVTYEDGE